MDIRGFFALHPGQKPAQIHPAINQRLPGLCYIP
jgi:hypothetical protein